jgi:hypothetical protein
MHKQHKWASTTLGNGLIMSIEGMSKYLALQNATCYRAWWFVIILTDISEIFSYVQYHNIIIRCYIYICVCWSLQVTRVSSRDPPHFVLLIFLVSVYWRNVTAFLTLLYTTRYLKYLRLFSGCNKLCNNKHVYRKSNNGSIVEVSKSKGKGKIVPMLN